MTVGQKSQHIQFALAKLPQEIEHIDVLSFLLRELLQYDVNVCARVKPEFKFHRGTITAATVYPDDHVRQLELRR